MDPNISNISNVSNISNNSNISNINKENPKKTSSKFKKYFTLVVILACAFFGYKLYMHNIHWHIIDAFIDNELPVINKEKSFSIIVVPDTQYYSRKYPETFCAQTDWILETKDRLNTILVSHMGDIVDDGGDFKQWDIATKCMSKLDGKIPYTIIPGNHDTDRQSDKSSGFRNYNSKFPASLYQNEKWYIDNFEQNQNSAVLVEKLGIKILFINLEIEPTDNAIAWANNVIEKNPNIYTIVTTHKYLPDDTDKLDEETRFSDPGPNNNGSQIWRKLVNNNCQIRMVWNGHYHNTDGENRLTSKNSCGNNVEQILQDYQMREKGGNGLLRIYTFTPEEKKIEVSTYSPTTKEFEIDASSYFELDFDLL